jgi:hypothetical protein
MRFIGRNRFNWTNALGEVLLIFVGISLSLVFDEWRTNRANRFKENELLYLLKESVQSDIDGLNYQIETCKTAIKMREYLINELPNSPKLTDSLSIAFSWMAANTKFSPQLTGYKNLEASGLMSVSDDKLRASIIDYYTAVEFYVEWGDKTQKFLDEYFTPRIISDFSEFNFKEKGVPISFEKTKSDFILMNIIKSANRRSYVTLEALEGHKREAEEFLTKLPNRDNGSAR